MTKDRHPVTTAVRMLREHGVEFTHHPYEYEERGGRGRKAEPRPDGRVAARPSGARQLGLDLPLQPRGGRSGRGGTEVSARALGVDEHSVIKTQGPAWRTTRSVRWSC